MPGGQGAGEGYGAQGRPDRDHRTAAVAGAAGAGLDTADGGGPLRGGRHHGRRIGQGGRRATEGTTAGQSGGIDLGQAGEGGGVGRGVALAVTEDGGGGGGIADLARRRVG